MKLEAKNLLDALSEKGINYKLFESLFINDKCNKGILHIINQNIINTN